MICYNVTHQATTQPQGRATCSISASPTSRQPERERDLAADLRADGCLKATPEPATPTATTQRPSAAARPATRTRAVRALGARHSDAARRHLHLSGLLERAGRHPAPMPELRHDPRGRLQRRPVRPPDTATSSTLLESFLRSRGNLREMERELGISYPTVRSRVEALVRALGFGPAGRRGRRRRAGRRARRAARTREEILEAVARHEMSAEDAAAAIRALGRTAR